MLHSVYIIISSTELKHAGEHKSKLQTIGSRKVSCIHFRNFFQKQSDVEIYLWEFIFEKQLDVEIHFWKGRASSKHPKIKPF